ncbi:MAG TPA: FtsX-like permease family protein [Thermoanaerobaculia bacterium]|nr:FtsX-like permease family protein [Thermoanaerobaculia bacterium]
MKFSSLVLHNLFRNKIRTVLTLALMGAIFFFVSTLLSILANFDQASTMNEGQNRLGVQSAISLANPLPLSHEEKIRAVPGVTDVAKLQWVGAYYKDQKNFFANFAVDRDKMETIWDDYHVAPANMAAFKNDKRGAIVGPGLARRFGWKVGDRVNLTGTIFPFNPELTVRGIYQHKVDDSTLFFRMDYFQDAVGPVLNGMVGTFWAKVGRREDMPRVKGQIDAMFKNSDYPTETFTEKEFQQQFISMIGNIKLLFTTVSICAVFMVILLAAITMSMSARERVTEIAVLKAIGFSRRLIMILMLIEFVTIAVAGGLLGTLGARFLYKFVDMGAVTQGFLVNFGVNNQTVIICLLTSVIVGFLAGGLPAIRSANLSVVNGLRKVV